MAEGTKQPQATPQKPPIIPALIAVLAVGAAGSYYFLKKGPDTQAKSSGGSAATSHYESGIKLAQSGNLTGAANEWQTAIGLDPSYAPPYLALIKKSEQEGDVEGAVKQLEALGHADPQAKHIACRQASIYLKANRYETSVTMVRDALKKEPDCPQAHTLQGAILAKGGDWKGAVEELKSAHQALPEEPAVTLALAVSLARNGKAQEGITLIEGLPTQARESVPALYRLGWLLAEYGRDGKKDPKAALEVLNQALAKAPNDADSNAWVGTLLLEQGKLQEARTHFALALQADNSNVKAAQGMAEIFARQKLPNAARAKQVAEGIAKQEIDLRQARGRYLTHPEDTDNTLKLVTLEARTGNRVDALTLIKHTLQSDPNNDAALKLLHSMTTSLQK